MTTQSEQAAPAATGQKPRLVLMGEFSSGKSTLSNILLGGPTLPMQITATRLPPVHITYGEPGAFALGRDGVRREVDLSDLGKLSPDEIQSLHLTMISDTLELCDLIDMPGISDPNMPADTWDAVVRSSDHVIWCTHATQAWRQSEAAAWDRMREATSGLNLLLITQFDKLRNPRDRARVLSRVVTETSGKFTAVYPISLLDAFAAGDDFDAWKESGANEFMEHLIEILLTPDRTPDQVIKQPPPDARAMQSPAQAADSDPVGRQKAFETVRPAINAAESKESNVFAMPDPAAAPTGIRVLPRRVQAKPGGSNLPRPPRPASTDSRAWSQDLGAI